MWGMVGEILRDDAHSSRMEKHIFTHRSLSIAYSGDKIIQVNLTSENPVPIEVGRTLYFTYSVHLKLTNKAFENRFDRYLEYDFFEHKIHWFSVFNSLMMVIFLCGLVGLILMRILHNDFARWLLLSVSSILTLFLLIWLLMFAFVPVVFYFTISRCQLLLTDFFSSFFAKSVVANSD